MRVPLLSALALTACYGAARPTPAKPELPPLTDGAEVDIDIDTPRYWSDSSGRYVTGYLIDGMTYNDVPLTYHQMRSLADPAWPGKLAAYDKLVKRCRRANIPRYLGFAGVVIGGGLYTGGGALFGENGTLHATVSLSALGFGVLSYAAGYAFLGGGACREAEHVAEKLNLAGADEGRVYDDDLILELVQIAKAFNKRMAHTAKQEPAEP
jgi:hypothetical protein